MIQCNEFLKLLQILKELLDVTLGNWKTGPLDFKLKEDVNPICSRTYPVPKVHEEMVKKEAENLVPLGVSKVANDSEWVSPSFDKPKPKSN